MEFRLTEKDFWHDRLILMGRDHGRAFGKPMTGDQGRAVTEITRCTFHPEVTNPSPTKHRVKENSQRLYDEAKHHKERIKQIGDKIYSGYFKPNLFQTKVKTPLKKYNIEGRVSPAPTREVRSKSPLQTATKQRDNTPTIKESKLTDKKGRSLTPNKGILKSTIPPQHRLQLQKEDYEYDPVNLVTVTEQEKWRLKGLQKYLNTRF